MCWQLGIDGNFSSNQYLEMKKLIIFIFYLVMISCECEHKDNEHVPNDTLLCVVDKKSKNFSYNVVLHIMECKYNVKFRNIETGNCRTINRKLFYDTFNIGDTIYEIVRHCPSYRVELKKKQ